MTYNFKGKTAVVTGASRGIGEAIARTLANDGAKVALVARSADKLKALAASLPNGAVAIEADMSSLDGWKSAAANALAVLGEIDILVNNAGVSAAQAMGKVTPETASTKPSTSTCATSSCSPTRSPLR
jgi:NADP-dependent 3-hydroxy acid dehydrogenase YdfG